MASASVGAVLPLWRIHNFTGLGTTVSIINIGRPDTIALLRYLGERSDPLKAPGKLTLAVDYAAELSTLREATLVRIKSVSPGDKPGCFSAELQVLCNTRIEDLSTSGSFPTARRASDLAPLWRIHNLGTSGEVTFDTEPKKITNIARDDTVALLKSLGGGNAKRAKGHLVLACDYKKELNGGLRAMLVRIGEVTYLSGSDQPPFGCTLTFLGHVRCARVYTDGRYPQCMLEEMPVWRIYNLNKGRGEVHQITNIARPDSIALLTHLGIGNPLNATGALVIGCDYEFPPSSGESGRLMRVVKVAHSTGSGKYEAVLEDVDTVSIGQLRVSSQQDSWWPRVAIQLPKVWRHSAAEAAADVPPSPRTSAPVQRPAKACPYWQRCEQALLQISRNSGLDLDEYRQKDSDLCFCIDCHRQRREKLVYQRGGQSYVLPLGYARISLKVFKTPAVVQRGLAEWHVCYHGTRYQYIPDLIQSGQLLSPGSSTYMGDVIAVREGHIAGRVRRRNEHTGEEEMFDPTNKIFFSPTMKYCDYGSYYMNEFGGGGRQYRVALQVRLQPRTYQIGQQTVSHKGGPIDENIPNSSIEWYTAQLQTHFFTGVLVVES